MKKKKSEIPKKYDVELAIEARRIILFEVHSQKECQRLVWQPIKKLLKELERQKPNNLVCLHSPLYSYKKPLHPPNQGGKCSDIDLVGPKNKLMYLGTIVDREEAKDLWNWYLERYPADSPMGELLRKKGPMAIIREYFHCTIPVDFDDLNSKAMEQGIRLFLKSFAPSLSGLPIKWMPKNEQKILANFLWQEAKRKANPQTIEEKEQILEEDARNNPTE